MKTYTPEELKEIVRLHGMWLREEGGACANLRNANMSGADLCGADLCKADLSGANLTCADLSGADLAGADLAGADLAGADLRGVKLADANLASCRGIQYVQFSFQGLGEASRQWSAVKIDGIWKVFCGCWAGTLEELEVRIYQEGEPYLKTRLEAYRYMREMCRQRDEADKPLRDKLLRMFRECVSARVDGEDYEVLRVTPSGADSPTMLYLVTNADRDPDEDPEWAFSVDDLAAAEWHEQEACFVVSTPDEKIVKVELLALRAMSVWS